MNIFVGMLQHRVARELALPSSRVLHVKGKGKLNASLNVVNLLRKGVHFKEMIDINNLKIAASGKKEVGLYHTNILQDRLARETSTSKF